LRETDRQTKGEKKGEKKAPDLKLVVLLPVFAPNVRFKLFKKG
jgi:hypothetical protein